MTGERERILASLRARGQKQITAAQRRAGATKVQARQQAVAAIKAATVSAQGRIGAVLTTGANGVGLVLRDVDTQTAETLVADERIVDFVGRLELGMILWCRDDDDARVLRMTTTKNGVSHRIAIAEAPAGPTSTHTGPIGGGFGGGFGMIDPDVLGMYEQDRAAARASFTALAISAKVGRMFWTRGKASYGSTPTLDVETSTLWGKETLTLLTGLDAAAPPAFAVAEGAAVLVVAEPGRIQTVGWTGDATPTTVATLSTPGRRIVDVVVCEPEGMIYWLEDAHLEAVVYRCPVGGGAAEEVCRRQPGHGWYPGNRVSWRLSVSGAFVTLGISDTRLIVYPVNHPGDPVQLDLAPTHPWQMVSAFDRLKTDQQTAALRKREAVAAAQARIEAATKDAAARMDAAESRIAAARAAAAARMEAARAAQADPSGAVTRARATLRQRQEAGANQLAEARSANAAAAAKAQADREVALDGARADQAAVIQTRQNEVSQELARTREFADGLEKNRQHRLETAVAFRDALANKVAKR